MISVKVNFIINKMKYIKNSAILFTLLSIYSSNTLKIFTCKSLNNLKGDITKSQS
jgi:hypothetical protein